MIVTIRIKDADIATIAFLAVSVDAGGKDMSCDCLCHMWPSRTSGLRCPMCEIPKNGCNIHGVCKAPENMCELHPKVKLTDCYRCHLEKEHGLVLF